jgi:hypothetical protein
MTLYSFRRRRTRRIALLAAAVSAWGVGPAMLPAANSANWLTTTSGNWTDPSKWSSAPFYPNNGNPAGTTYNAAIAPAGSSAFTVTFTGTVALDSLTLNNTAATLLHRGDLTTPLIDVQKGAYVLDLGSIVGATIQTNPAGGGTFETNRGILDGVTIGGNSTLRQSEVRNGLTLVNNPMIAAVRLGSTDGGLTFNGTQTLGGTGTISFNGPGYAPIRVSDGATLTIGTGVTFQSGGGNLIIGGLVGVSSADQWINKGTIANNSSLSGFLMGRWHNDGVFKVSAGTLVLAGSFTDADLGTIQQSGTGKIAIAAFINNTGNTFQPTITAGVPMSINTYGGFGTAGVFGGTVSATAALPLTIGSGDLTNVTIAGDGVTVGTAANGKNLTIGASAQLKVPGHLTIVATSSTSTGEVIHGPGDIVMAGGLLDSLNVPLETDSTLTIRGAGTIQVGYGFTNHGKITGNIVLGGQVSSNIFYVWHNLGLLDASGGSTISLRGSFTPADIGNYNATGGKINIDGILDNTGNTLLLDGPSKSLGLSKTITGGTVRTINGAELRVYDLAGDIYFDGVNIDTDLVVPSPADLRFSNTTTLAAGRTVKLLDQTTLAINTLLGGNGTISLAGGSFPAALDYETNAVIDTGITLRTDGGNGAIGFNYGGVPRPITSKGNIFQQSAGTTLYILNPLTNEGTMTVTAGTVRASGFVNKGTTTISGGLFDVSSLNNSGTFTLSGGQVNLGGTVDPVVLGTVTRTGGTVVLTGTFNNTNTTNDLTAVVGPWLIGSGATIKGGSIDPQTVGQPLSVLASSTFVINGSAINANLSLTSGVNLTLSGAWTNNATISGSSVQVTYGGTFATSAMGSIASLTSSTLIYNGTINNAGATLPVTTTGSNLFRIGQSANITGGSIGQTGTTIQLQGGTLNGVTLLSNATVSTAKVTMTNGLTLGGSGMHADLINTTTPGNPSGVPGLEFSGTQTLGGSGDVVFEGGAANSATVRPLSGTLTLGPGITIRTGTRGGIVGNTGLTTVNQGLISARTAGQTITLAGVIDNQGTIEAINGGIIAQASGASLIWSGGSIGGAGAVTVGNTSITENATKPGSGVLRVNGTFAIAPGKKLDLTTGKLILKSGDAGSLAGSGYTGATGLIQSGRNGGNWDGSGIVTSQSHAVGRTYTSIAVARASDVRPATVSTTATWAGQTITGTDVLVMYTYGGDANLDGTLNIDDYVRIDHGISAGLSGWSNGDFNYDGKINIDDYANFIDSNLLIQGAAFPAGSGVAEGMNVVAVPEPMGLGVIVAAAGLLSRRRRDQVEASRVP